MPHAELLTRAPRKDIAASRKLSRSGKTEVHRKHEPANVAEEDHSENDDMDDDMKDPDDLGDSQELEDDNSDDVMLNDEDLSDEDMQEDDEDNLNDNQPENEDLRNISFGALASAQDELQSNHRRHRSTRYDDPQDPRTRTDADKVNILRDRLAELKALKSKRANTTTKSSRNPTASHDETLPFETASSTRPSKHAPTSQSSKYQVPRKRAIIPISSNPTHARDPRFLAGRLTTSELPESETARFEHNYSFLSTYRAAEAKELRTALSAVKHAAKKRKSGALTADEEVEKERLERAVQSVGNRAKADRERERLKEVVAKHRKEEREAVKAGKKPFFLKKSEIKKRVVEERWRGMKGREKDKAVKRKRKKISEAERRAMPNERRAI